MGLTSLSGPEPSTITDSFAARLSPSVLDRARPPGLWTFTAKFSASDTNDGVYPDGKRPSLSAPKRFRYAEVLFRESVQPADSATPLCRINRKCDVNTRKNLYVDVVSSGVTNMFPETFERMTKELTA